MGLRPHPLLPPPHGGHQPVRAASRSASSRSSRSASRRTATTSSTSSTSPRRRRRRTSISSAPTCSAATTSAASSSACGRRSGSRSSSRSSRRRSGRRSARSPGTTAASIDNLLMRFTDLILTLPGLAVLLTAAAFFGTGDPLKVGLILALLFWTGIARIVRGVFLSLREKEYVEAAKASGAERPPDHPASHASELARADHRQHDADHRGRDPRSRRHCRSSASGSSRRTRRSAR